MTIKTFFDVTWQGPVMQNGRATKEIKGNSSHCPTTCPAIVIVVAAIPPRHSR